ncbi:MAG: hypothetical protein IJJ33_02690, partial [Victivallales bacterium]|nr:hypothetical protein [Victivallales bacterium]
MKWLLPLLTLCLLAPSILAVPQPDRPDKEILKNPRFQERDAQGQPKGWRPRAVSLDLGHDGADVTLRGANGKGGLIYHFLTPPLGRMTAVNCEVSAQGGWRSYVEWYEGKEYCRTSAEWRGATDGWSPLQLVFQPKAPYRNCIVVFATQSGAPLSIRGLQAKLH